MTAA
jgi:hypothetical protein